MSLSFLKQQPTKVVLVGLNYKDHAKELKMRLPEEPILFLKPPTSLIGMRIRSYTQHNRKGWITRLNWQ